jgi:hypothetical protein
MRKLILAALALVALSGCAGIYVGGDVGPRRVIEPAALPYP